MFGHPWYGGSPNIFRRVNLCTHRETVYGFHCLPKCDDLIDEGPPISLMNYEPRERKVICGRIGNPAITAFIDIH